MSIPSKATAAEYYCEYKIERVFGDEKTVRTPKLFFERDYRTPDLPYTLFAIPYEWLNQQKTLSEIRDKTDTKVIREALNKLPYDRIKVVYDKRGIACTPLTDISSKEYNEAEIKDELSFEQFYQAGCRLDIEKNQSHESQDHSGTGTIDMNKGDRVIARFYFAVNFTFRRKIAYKLEVTGKTLNLEFKCKESPVGVPVRVIFNQDRLPCLKNDLGVNIVDEFVLEFRHGRATKKLELTDSIKNAVFSVTICDEKYNKFYLMDCIKNTTVSIREKKVFYPTISYTCPYCHRPIDYRVASDSRYRKGGTVCSPNEAVGKELPIILSKHKSKLKKCLYCLDDIYDGGSNKFVFNTYFQRLLPTNYMEHTNFKVAFVGSKRAGKTTYISRFFGITNGKDDDKISMPMTITANSMKKFGVNIQSASIPDVDPIGGGAYQVTDANWSDSNNQYTSRSICLDPQKYPSATANGDYTKFPFIAEVNGRSYISFYDIAGEDAQHSVQIKNIANGEFIGVFCIINGKADIGGNNAVVNMLVNAGLDAHCPIAVILTKMDTIENGFDSHCSCLRSDYFREKGEAQYADVEWEINYSSEEIRSYLKDNRLLPDIESKFNNVKYFGVSSFNFMESIHEDLADFNAPGSVKFECSSKRMELPFLWMLKQFDVIR